MPKRTAIRALQQQRDEFGNVATEYANYARGICQVEVAQAEASVASDAWSHLNVKNTELDNAANIVASLRDTIGTVEERASNESNQNRFIKEQAVAELHSLQENSKQSERQNIGRLETEAQSRHESILKDRLINEANWKAQAETKHAAVVDDLRAQLNDTSNRLNQSLENVLELKAIIRDRDAKLVQAEAVVKRFHESNETMTSEFQEQQKIILRLNADTARLNRQASETDLTQDAIIKKNRALIIEIGCLKDELVQTRSALEDQQLQLANLGSSFEDLKGEFAEERQNFTDNLEKREHTISHQMQIIKELRSKAEENQANGSVFKEMLEETPKLEQPSFGPSARPQEFDISDTPQNARTAGGISSAPCFPAPPTSLTQESAGGNSLAKRPIPDFSQRPDGRPANYAFDRAEWIGQPKAAKEGPAAGNCQAPSQNLSFCQVLLNQTHMVTLWETFQQLRLLTLPTIKLLRKRSPWVAGPSLKTSESGSFLSRKQWLLRRINALMKSLRGLPQLREPTHMRSLVNLALSRNWMPYSLPSGIRFFQANFKRKLT